MHIIECSPKTNDYTLAFLDDETQKKHYVMSKYEPKEKALKYLDNVDYGNKSTIWILFGFQFGYIIDKILEVAGEDINILVIEPDKQALEDALELCGHFYEDKINIKFFSGSNWIELKEKLDTLIGMENFNNFRIIATKEYLTYYKDYYKHVLELIDQRSEDKVVNYHTIIAGNTYNIVNTVQNRYELAKTCDMMKHYNKFKDIPAVLVLAGPSLDKNIEYLKEFNGLIFIIGRTITPVLNLGVKPDLIFAVDPYGFSIATFGEYQTYDIPLFTLGQCSHKVVEGCQSPYKYFLYNTSEIEGLLGIRINPGLDLSGSVATLCLSTAQFFGCSPIILIGQDLAYSGDKLYANQADALYTPEMKNKAWGMRKIKGYYGDEVYSSGGMITFLRWIEDFMYHNPSSKYINSTEGGAYIEGAEHISFKEAIDLYNPKEKVTMEHTFLKDNEGVDVDRNLLEGIKGIKIVQKSVHKSIEEFNRIIQFYKNEKPSKKRDKKVLKHMKKINKYDKEIEEIKRVSAIMNMLLKRAQAAISSSNDCKEPLNETKEEFRLRYLKVNRDTYDYVEKECMKLLDLLIVELPKELQIEYFMEEIEEEEKEKLKERDVYKQ